MILLLTSFIYRPYRVHVRPHRHFAKHQFKCAEVSCSTATLHPSADKHQETAKDKFEVIQKQCGCCIQQKARTSLSLNCKLSCPVQINATALLLLLLLYLCSILNVSHYRLTLYHTTTSLTVCLFLWQSCYSRCFIKGVNKSGLLYLKHVLHCNWCCICFRCVLLYKQTIPLLCICLTIMSS